MTILIWLERDVFGLNVMFCRHRGILPGLVKRKQCAIALATINFRPEVNSFWNLRINSRIRQYALSFVRKDQNIRGLKIAFIFRTC